jgi:hypothetical protein
VLRAELYLDRGRVKSRLPPPAAKFYIETGTMLNSLILLREINELSVVLNDYLARNAEKRLFTQALKKFNLVRSAGKMLLAQPQRLSRSGQAPYKPSGSKVSNSFGI